VQFGEVCLGWSRRSRQGRSCPVLSSRVQAVELRLVEVCPVVSGRVMAVKAR
jgi:hypothetical protein